MHRSPRARAGVTLIELLFTLVLLGILASLAAPRLSAWIRRTEMTALLDELTADIFYARMLAVRTGRRVEIRFSAGSNRCIDAYRIVVVGTPERVAKRVDVRRDARALCLTTTAALNPTSFDSRGLPAGISGSYTVSHGAMSEKINLAFSGRVYRVAP